MTITIPTWLLYILYGIGGILISGLIFVVLSFAFMGWVFRKAWRPPNW